MTISITRRVRELEGTDVIQYINGTGSAIVNNQLIFMGGDTGYGRIGVALEPIAAAAGSIGAVAVKGVFELPAAAAGFTQGLMAMASTGGSSVTAGGLAYTTSGYWGIGMITKLSAVGTDTTASQVEVDLNVGPKAFIVN
jgi:predicted RecA/RadA family phage recombinase